MTWQPRLPKEIEAESFRRIEAQVGPHHLPPEVWFVVRRMIHTSADPEYLASARIHPRAIAAGVEALKRGAPVATDTRMLLAGISTGRLDRLGVKAFCLMDDPDVAAEAARRGTTRAEVAMERSLPKLAGGIVAIGNAPTALLRLLELLAVRGSAAGPGGGGAGGVRQRRGIQGRPGPPGLPLHHRPGAQGRLGPGSQHRQCPGHHGPGGGAVMTTKTGTLYGIGVGPGDPELITLKAIKVLHRVPHIFAACSTKNNYSLALSIVRCHLNGAGIEHLPFPMSRDTQVLASAWEQNARRVLEVLASGSDAAFVTLGDPLTYSTFGYLLKTLKGLAPEVSIVTIPGITSYSAAAALTHIPLTEGEESFYLVSGALGATRLKEVVEKSDNIVILKTYRYFDEIYQVLEDMDLLDRATCISRCGLEGETIVENLRDLKGRDLPYLSMIIIKKQGKGY